MEWEGRAVAALNDVSVSSWLPPTLRVLWCSRDNRWLSAVSRNADEVCWKVITTSASR